LSSDKFTTDLNKQSRNFGNDIDSLITLYNGIKGVHQIPGGIGGFVNQLIIFGGDIYIKTKQGKEIKNIVPKADTLIGMMTTNLKEFLNGKIYLKAIADSISLRGLIKNEKDGFEEGYKSYVATCARLKTLPTLDSEKEYLNTLNVIDGVSILLEQTISATDGLRKAHRKLLREIEEKKSLKQSICELQSYSEDIKKIQTTIGKIENSKK
jgi:hypothetical protein